MEKDIAYILLVEDNDDHAILAQVALSNSDQAFEVDRASSANDCFSMLAGKSYDAILLDYSLPKRNGLEILADIRKIPYDAPVVMITSHGDEKVAVEAMKHGAYDYVSKTKDYLEKLPLVLQKAIKSHNNEKDKALLQARIEESEIRLRNIFENAGVGLIEIDENCRVTYANPKAEEYLGIENLPEINKICSVFTGIGSQESDCDGCIIKDCLKTKSLNREIEYCERQFSISLTSLSGDSAKKLIMVIMDITEQKKLQQHIIQSERMSVLGRMASGVAHKFNNILAVIMGQTELLMSNSQHEMDELKIIRRATEDGAEAVKRLQDFTRVAKQKEFEEVKIDDIVRDALYMTELGWRDQTQYEVASVDVLTNLKSSAIVMGNTADLKEAITNIIFNALDAMPNGGTLSIETYNRNDRAFISISDTGVGIRPEIINNIFEPFFTTKGPGHTGLGLSVAYGTIIRHEGKIEISNENGDKTEFIISIPIAEVKAAIKESVTISDEGQKSKILVIDDEEMIRNLLGDILNRLGHEATTASNGQEGVELFKSMKHDLVFTDLGMPGLSGWEVAHQIKSYDQNSVIIMITGWGVELSDRELSEKQVDFVISKPFRLHQIREVIPKALNLRK